MSDDDAQQHAAFVPRDTRGTSERQPTVHHIATYEPRPISDERNRELIRQAIRQAPSDTAGRALRPAG